MVQIGQGAQQLGGQGFVQLGAHRQMQGPQLVAAGKLTASPVRDHVAAVSVGIFEGQLVLDLDYPEDSACDTDMNVIMTGAGGIVEIQGTAEGEPFTRTQMNQLVDMAEAGIAQLIAKQKEALAA